MASTMSLIVTPSCLPIALTSARSSVALAKVRPGVTTWLRKVAGGWKLRARSGADLDSRRTRRMPLTVSDSRRGSSLSNAA
jgi:hypothetical protein